MTRYKIDNVTPVGEGGFGKVRMGTDTVLERKVAVKVLNEAWATADENDKERFRREARTLAKLSHPNIPSVYDVDFGTNGDSFEIVVQFVEGRTLRKILDDESTIKLEECRIWFDQIASALDHAHENGIIHRDVKPENIIVSPDRKHCYLVDFGIALSKADLRKLTDSDQWIGTPGYMSPEQQNGEVVDSSDDCYVLGCCLYEALCGHQIEPGVYQPLNSINELIPAAIDELVQRCIARKPMRLKSAGDFRARLQSALSQHRALSELLAAGQLHEIVYAIADMTPTQFMELKAGQRLLILQKCVDLVNSSDRRLARAREEFIEILTPLGIHLSAVEYSKIVIPAIRLGFGVEEPEGHGIRVILEALVEAATKVTVPNHHVIVEALLDWVGKIELNNQRAGLYHWMRNVICALMANPECDDADAPKLADLLAVVNEMQNSRVQDNERDEIDSDQEAA